MTDDNTHTEKNVEHNPNKSSPHNETSEERIAREKKEKDMSAHATK